MVFTYTNEQAEKLERRYNALAKKPLISTSAVCFIFSDDADEDFANFGQTEIILKSHETKSGREESFTVYASQITLEK